LNNFRSADPVVKQKVANNFNLIQYELKGEIALTKKNFSRFGDLNPSKFDSSVFNDTYAYIEQIKEFYVNRYNRADRAKDKAIIAQTDTPEKEAAFTVFREHYHNDAIADLVKNLSETHRIIEKDGKLVQKIYPIYKDPDPDHAIDFNAQFYMPAKHFLNRNVDTFVFNTGVIWSMSLVLALTLYFDILRRVVDGIGNLSNPLNRRK
jgi:hypothetical protein